MFFEEMYQEAIVTLLPHKGHKLVIVEYAPNENHSCEISVECEDCNETLASFHYS